MSKLRNTFVKKIVYFPGYSPMMNGKDKIEFVSLFVPCIVCGFYARDDTGNGSFLLLLFVKCSSKIDHCTQLSLCPA